VYIWSLQEKATFVKLFKEYKDIFAWTYGDLKTFDTSIMQHVIPLEKQAKPYQQKLCKMHPSLKSFPKHLCYKRVLIGIKMRWKVLRGKEWRWLYVWA